MTIPATHANVRNTCLSVRVMVISAFLEDGWSGAATGQSPPACDEAPDFLVVQNEGMEKTVDICTHVGWIMYGLLGDQLLHSYRQPVS